MNYTKQEFINKLKPLPRDMFGRKTYLLDKRLYKDVDGILHTSCSKGEPEYPVKINGEQIEIKEIKC